MATQNLFEMRGAVRDIVPRPPSAIDVFINRRIQAVIHKRDWADLLRVGQIAIPNQYATGTVTTTNGSNLVNGTGTVWPINDAINTTISKAIVDAPGVVEIFPTSMTGIAQGQYLLLDQGTPAVTEIVVILAVGPGSFQAFCQNAHSSGVTLQKSSLANLQFRASNGSGLSTVQAVLSATQLQIDIPYSGQNQVNISYNIFLLYGQLSATARRVFFCWDPVAGQEVGTDKTEEWMFRVDPQLTSTDQPQELLSAHPNPGGVMQWAIWPPQNSAYSLLTIYMDGWPKLVFDTDRSPFFLDYNIFQDGALADCFITSFIQGQGRQDPLMNPAAADMYQQSYLTGVESAIERDEGRWLKALQDYRSQVMGAYNAYNWQRSHAIASEPDWRW